MQEIAKGVFVNFDYRGANVGCVLTEEGAIVVDTPLVPEDGRKWAGQVASMTDRVLYLFNTDHHRGHVMGNQFFGAPIVAHEEAWREMTGYKESFIERTKNLFKKQPEVVAQFDEVNITPPQITFTEKLVLKKGGREIHFIHLGGHTTATSGLFLPDERVLFCGDLVVVGEHPALGQGNSREWLDVLSRLRKWKLSALIPGHGPTCTLEETQPVSEYIRTLRSKVRKQYRAGRSKSDAAVVISQMIDYFPYEQQEKSQIEKRIRAGISRVYDEMKAEYGPVRK